MIKCNLLGSKINVRQKLEYESNDQVQPGEVAAILIGPLDTSKLSSNRTSGHLKVEMLLRPLDTKEDSSRPEIGLGFSAS